MEHSQGWCASCKRSVMAARPEVNHVLHLLLTLFLCGLWAPVWLIMALVGATQPWHCPLCGGPTTYDAPPQPRAPPPVPAAPAVVLPEPEGDPIRFQCGGCHAVIKMRRAHAGRKVRCPRCSVTLRVPNA